MKIAFICGFAWEPKGTVRSRAFPLAAELTKLGHEVRIFLAPYDNLSDSGKEYIRSGVRITNLEMSSNSLPFRIRLSHRLASESLAWSPDLVHVFKPKGLAGIAARVLLRRGTVPVVLDCDDWEGWGGWNEVKDYSWFTKQFIDWQEKSLIRTAATITVASRVLESRATEIGRNPGEIFYVPNCISEEMLAAADVLTAGNLKELRRSIGLSDSTTILYVGHFDPLDDVMFFSRNAAPVAAQLGAAIAFVGDGPELPRVKRFFTDYPQLRVHYFGRLSHTEYTRVLAAADIATFPYPDNPVYRAKCSARIIDFMAFAKAVLSSAVGQNSEYLASGDTGILVAAGDGEGYRRVLAELLSNEDLRRRLGARARERIREAFLWSGGSTRTCLRAYSAATGVTSESELASGKPARSELV